MLDFGTPTAAKGNGNTNNTEFTFFEINIKSLGSKWLEDEISFGDCLFSGANC